MYLIFLNVPSLRFIVEQNYLKSFAYLFLFNIYKNLTKFTW